MDLFCRSRRNLAPFLATSTAFGMLFTAGCASPGPPRAPSLNLPQQVSDLAADRTGDTVELRFTVPRFSTDKTLLYDPKHHHTSIRGVVCREVDHRDCAAVASIQPTLTAVPRTPFTFKDKLPAVLTSGSPHLIGYRVEFFNDLGSSAGKSQPAFTVSGPTPGPVSDLHAEGTRHGVLLQWTAPNTSGEVLLNRVALAPKPVLQPKPATPSKSSARASGSAIKHDDRDDQIWLATNSAEGRTLDSTVVAGEPYRYTAVRRTLVTIGTRTFDLRSAPSAPIDFTLSETYPPDAPTAFTAVGFQPPTPPGATEAPHFAVDLIWQPVDNSIAAQLAPPIAGYNIYRETLDAQGHPTNTRTRLNPAAVPVPGYQDTTADTDTRYRYSVTAVDGKGNESASATVTLDPSQQ
jgi:hypothetical protein